MTFEINQGVRRGISGLLMAVGLVACGEEGEPSGQKSSDVAVEAKALFTDERRQKGRMRLALENPRVIMSVATGFGGEMSREAAQHMFSRNEAAIKDVKSKTHIEEAGPRSWFVRLPIVNSAVFETDEGLVVVDTGYGPAGPALMEAIRSVSNAPIHTIIYTHGHVDHAYGTWALLDEGAAQPNIIAHSALPKRVERYIDYRGSIAKYMSQPVDELPASEEDFVWPTQVFDDALDLVIGGEVFKLKHWPGETDDQLYVFVPGRGILVSADYYQGFTPNAGNGKRVQRHLNEWAQALWEMSELGATTLLPMHGVKLEGADLISEELSVLAKALDSVVTHARDGLNLGLRQDQVIDSFEWPEEIADHPSLYVHYVRPKDLVRMEVRRQTGWWDDIPSHWNAAPLQQQAAAIVELAGGIDALVEKTRALADKDPRLASHFADYAFYADPYDERAQKLTIEVYKKRVLDPTTPVQEKLAFFDHMSVVRALMMED